jgi:hypothetical protein
VAPWLRRPLPTVRAVRSAEDHARYGGLSVPTIAILVPLQGTVEVQVIASTDAERQSLRLDLRIDEAKAALVAYAMQLAGLGADDDEHDDDRDDEP